MKYIRSEEDFLINEGILSTISKKLAKLRKFFTTKKSRLMTMRKGIEQKIKQEEKTEIDALKTAFAKDYNKASVFKRSKLLKKYEADRKAITDKFASKHDVLNKRYDSTLEKLAKTSEKQIEHAKQTTPE